MIFRQTTARRQVLPTSSDPKKITFNVFTLSFPKDLEKEFQENLIRASVAQVRMALLLGIFFYGVFGFLDAWLAPAAKLKLWFIRYAVILPYAFLVFLATFTRYYKNYMQLINASMVMLAGLGIIAMIVIAPPQISQTYYAGLILVFVYGYTFLRLRFIRASITGWLIVLAYEIAAVVLRDTPVTTLVSNNFFFLTANILLMFACYSIEHYLRKDFIQARMLELEKKKVIASNWELEKRVQERTVQLQQINEDLKEEIAERKQTDRKRRHLETQLRKSQKMEAIGALAGGVAHDLNNILTGIVSYPDLLLLDLPEDSPLRKPIETLQASGKKAAAMVQDLLTLARRAVSVTEVVNLNRVIDEYLKSPEHAKLMYHHPNVRVRQLLDDHLLNIKGSPIHLSKTIMNLVSNAAEAMPEDGIISIMTRNQYIDKSLQKHETLIEGDYVVITICDTGIGISKEDVDRIFDPFYTKKVMGRSGTGLGMTVVWGTVQDHKGLIDVKSTNDKGTTFELYFPATREPTLNKPQIALDSYLGKGETILIVDDVKEQREITSEMLEKLGYSAISVTNGEEAVDYLKKNTVDLLILDMIMDPGIDGLETYKRLIEHRPRQKAIIVSGYSETKRVQDALNLGVGAYIRKPFSLEQIGQAISIELSK